MIQTSYFARYKNKDAVSIAVKHPPWFSLRVYPPLYPTWQMVTLFKRTGDWEAYVAEYSKILAKLEPKKVFNDLDNTVLLCWEKDRTYCHRRLVAEWLEQELGIVVEEVIFSKIKETKR